MQEAVALWQEDAPFRDFFGELLSSVPYDAFFWEMPPLDRSRFGREFEFVLVDAPALARVTPEPHAFREHFREARSGIATFRNLGGDAWLVAPGTGSDDGASAHLAAFQRQAPDRLKHELWQAVGRLVAEQVGDRPVWLSTSGLGVAWLHVRLDTVPKYYQHRPYRDER